ncbi:sulfite exporter TauE/SafE family protein [Paenibacillus nanensis]|uniref:Probable membrane transporter protein n=1 Tax=Paenibacillus nanensis TaxID=393251 RepID=A0A3A1VJ18_9BACL|nr:sulfite exporter TauE/SafE family protein [Paenibacillus nanensis]RIX59616.1 sulfite exporter TauE/SafE family protein [Paenibacillus nanensis]
MFTFLLLLAIGLTAGLAGSLVGLGGGFIVVPALAFLFPDMPPSHLAGTSMAMLLCNSVSSTYVYAKQQRIDYSAAIRFAAASIPGSVIGAIFAEQIEGRLFFISFGFFLIGIALLLLFKPDRPIVWPLAPTATRSFIDQSGKRFDYSYHMPTGIVISFLVGFLASLFGVGGGSLMIPTMTLLLGFPPHIAVATSMLQIFLSAIVSTSTHAALHNIDWSMVLLLAPGAIIGGQIGARLAKRLPAKLLLKILALLLIVVSVRLIMKG